MRKPILVALMALPLAGCGSVQPASPAASTASVAASSKPAVSTAPASSPPAKPAASGAAPASPSASVAFPTRTVTIVIPNSPGNEVDGQSRLIAPGLGKILGQQVVVVNKEGAATVIGSEYVAHQQPADGYNMAAVTDNTMALMPITIKDLPLDPLKDLPPFVRIAASRNVLVSVSNAPWKTFQELADNAKANPGKLSYGSSSASTHLQLEALWRAAGGLNIGYVPLSDTASNVAALLGEKTQVTITPESVALAQGNKVEILAQTGDQRSTNIPNVPLFSELGFPQERGPTTTFNLRAGTPKPIVDKLNTAVTQVLQNADLKTQFAKQGWQIPAPASADDAVKAQTDLVTNFTTIANDIGMKPQ